MTGGDGTQMSAPGASLALFKNKTMTNPFVHGLNQDKSLLDFVDVGGSQESIK